MDMSNQTGTTGQRLANIEVLDSDGDGFSNIDEINNLAFPGDPADTPAVTPYPAIIKWHRNVGIVLAPLLVLQGISGVFLSAEWLLGYHQRVGEVIRANVPPLIWLWDKILLEIHYGLGIPGAIEHIRYHCQFRIMKLSYSLLAH